MKILNFLIIIILFFFYFLNNGVLAKNITFNEKLEPSTDIFSYNYFNDFEGYVLTKQTLSFFGIEEISIAEIKINNSRIEFVLKRNDNKAFFQGQDFDKLKLVMRNNNRSIEVEDVFTAKSYSSNWIKLDVAADEKKLLKDAFNLMISLFGNQRMNYQKRIRIDLNDSIQKLLSTMGLNDTIEVSGEQMTFSEIIEKIYLQDSESKLIKLNLNNYGMIFVGEACIGGRKSYVINHDIGGVHIGFEIMDAESGLHIFSNFELTLFDDTGDKITLRQNIDSSFKNHLSNCNHYETNNIDNSPQNKLRSLKGLLDDGLISIEQYDKKASEILDNFY